MSEATSTLSNPVILAIGFQILPILTSKADPSGRITSTFDDFSSSVLSSLGRLEQEDMTSVIAFIHLSCAAFVSAAMLMERFWDINWKWYSPTPLTLSFLPSVLLREGAEGKKKKKKNRLVSWLAVSISTGADYSLWFFLSTPARTPLIEYNRALQIRARLVRIIRNFRVLEVEPASIPVILLEPDLTIFVKPAGVVARLYCGAQTRHNDTGVLFNLLPKTMSSLLIERVDPSGPREPSILPKVKYIHNLFHPSPNPSIHQSLPSAAMALVLTFLLLTHYYYYYCRSYSRLSQRDPSAFPVQIHICEFDCFLLLLLLLFKK